jgi:hypothetical protein
MLCTSPTEVLTTGKEYPQVIVVVAEDVFKVTLIVFVLRISLAW